MPVALKTASHADKPVAPHYQDDSTRIAQTLKTISDAVPMQRRLVRAGDKVAQCGDVFATLYIVNSGMFKAVSFSPDGDDQVVALHFRGDWMGLDAISSGRHGCDLVAMDTGEVWAVSYSQILAACSRTPELLAVLHGAMSRVINRDRDSKMSLCTLTAEARVADFLHHFACELGSRGLRSDQITLRLTRAEIGNYLGLTLETVSRVLSRLAKLGVIVFAEKGRRDIAIPDAGALWRLVSPAPAAH